MIRGLLSGTVQGTLLAGVGLIGASMVAPVTEPVTAVSSIEVTSSTQSGALSAPRPVAPDPEPAVIPDQPAPVPEVSVPEETAAVDVPPESRFNQSPGIGAPPVPDADQAPMSPDVAEPVATPDVRAPAPDTQTAAAPDPVQNAPSVVAPDEGGTPQVVATVETPSPQSAPQGLGPSQTTPPSVIVMDQVPPRPALAPPSEPETVAETVPESITDPETDMATDETSQTTAQIAPEPLPAPEPDVAVQDTDAQNTPAAPEDPAQETVAGGFVSVGTFTTGASTITTSTQVATLDTPAPEVVAPSEDTTPQIAPGIAEAAITEPTTVPALDAFAVPFERAPDRPVIGVIIIESPDSILDRATLLGFAIPVAFAVDAARPDAAAAVRQYREAGFEVLLHASSLPTEGTVGELAEAFSSAIDVVDEAVAILDTTDGFLQQTRVALDAVLEGTKVSGHGFLAYPQGLNSGEATARREGVPGLTVYRLLDAERESKPTIVRYLDRALFAAGQEGQAIVVGHSYQETVTALYAFQQSLRDSDPVAVAPISHILKTFGTQ